MLKKTMGDILLEDMRKEGFTDLREWLACNKQDKDAENKLKRFEFEVEDIGKISDGSHTFEELYYHRMFLFSILCNLHKDISWKSFKHSDGEVWDDYFIVGITTKEGNYTYHYQNQYWDMFDVEELEYAPKWDGHTSQDITRLLSLVK